MSEFLSRIRSNERFAVRCKLSYKKNNFVNNKYINQ